MLDELIAGSIKIEKEIKHPSTTAALGKLLLKMEDGDSFLLTDLSTKEKSKVYSAIYYLRYTKKLGSRTRVISVDAGLTSIRVWRSKEE